MKRIIAAALTVIIFSVICCSCGNGDVASTHNDDTVTFVYNNRNDKMNIVFDIDKDIYEFALVTASSGKLFTLEDTGNGSVAINTNVLYLYGGDGCTWAPADFNEQISRASIYIQICKGDTTLHCGTLSLVPLFEISLDDTQEKEYRVKMQSDDGLAVKGDDNGNIVIFAEE